jgi:putative ABC transport system permease protein
MRTLLARCNAVFRKRSLERSLSEELQCHLDMQIEENLQKGMTPRQARAEALRSFGGVEQVKETYRDRRGLPFLDSLLQDGRFTWRMLFRSPGFTTVAALTLALGIGANTAVFSVVDAVILRPLRFPSPQRLMVIQSSNKDEREAFNTAQGVFLDWRDRAASFEMMAGAELWGSILTGGEQAHPVEVAAVSYGFFQLTGVQPLLGRLFTEDEDRPGRVPVALLNAGFWEREFGGDPQMLGRTIVLDGTPVTVIGILPSDLRFAYFGATDIWRPLTPHRAFRSAGSTVVIGRLRDGTTQEAAQSEMDSIMEQIRRESIEDSKTYVIVKPLQEWMVGEVRTTFLALLGAVTFVLLIACANIANLLLARGMSRQKEMAIRAALGAGRRRLMRQHLLECGVLSLMGGALGLVLAVFAIRAIPAIQAFYIPRANELAIDQTVFGIAAAVTVASGLLFGLAPALQLSRKDLAAVLHQGDALSAGQVGGLRIRNVLVVAQLAMALVLLSGAGLLTSTLLRLLHLDLGFERDHVLTVLTSLPYPQYDHPRQVDFSRHLALEIGRLPGVAGVSLADYTPLQAVLFPYQLRVEHGGEQRTCEAMARNINPGYLGVMGIPLLAGRDFTLADDHRSPAPILLSRAAATALFGSENPLGKKIETNYLRRLPVLEVVGIVGDVRQTELRREPGPQIYLPFVYGGMGYVLARTARGPEGLARDIRRIVRSVDPDIPAPEISTMDATFAQQVAQPRFYLILLAGFAATGLVLAAIGIYGVLSYTVARRSREFAIRIAFGAEPRNIQRLVLAEACRLTAIGGGMGLAGAYAATRVLSSLLYGVKPGDPVTLGCVSMLLAGVALAAASLAARKATRLDPNVALHCE